MFGPPDHRVLDRTLPDQLLVTDSRFATAPPHQACLGAR
jgi:hypothetical protein